VRFRSDRYDPRRLAPRAESALVALQTFVAEIGRRASAGALVPSDRVGSGPIAMFESLEAYESELLRPAVGRRRPSEGDDGSSTGAGPIVTPTASAESV
jgi:hypothetical protein